MEKLAAKIDEALNRLDNLEQLIKSQGTGGAEAGPVMDAGADDSSHPYAIFVADLMKPLSDRVAKIGGDLVEAFDLFVECSKINVATVIMASKSKKPSDSEFGACLKPLSEGIEKVRDFRDKNRASKQFFHLSVLYEIVPAFGWVAAAPTPAPHVRSMLEAGDFYMNKILREYRGKDENQVSWAKELKVSLGELEKYVKKTYTTGMTWNPKGGAAHAPTIAGGNAPAAPPAPAPPPPAPAGAPAPAKSGGGMTDVFSQLSKGDDVTSGLKKVTQDMKTKNRPKEERVGKVSSTGSKPAPRKYGAAAAKKEMPPKFGLEGKKWVVEYQKKNEGVIVEADQCNAKQTAYIYKCENSIINIKGKINHVTVDACKKCGIVFTDLVSGIDVVNSSSCKVQGLGLCPSVTIEKTSGATIYIPEKSLGMDIVTSTSSEVNVSYEYKGDFKEAAIPEQFVTKIVNGVLTTKQMEYV